MAPVGCAAAPPISGQLTIEGIPVLGLVDTGASITCLGFAIWWHYRTQWGALKQFEGTVHGAQGKPLNIAGRTEHLDIQWGEARGRASFIVIVGLESPPCLIGMDIMRPLRVHIDVTNGTATPAQPDPQTIHLNAAQRHQPQKRLPAPTASPPPQPQSPRETPAPGAPLLAEGTAAPSSPQPQRQEKPLAEDRGAALPSPVNPSPKPPGDIPSAPLSLAPPSMTHPHTASCARLLQKADIPPETARLVRCHNPWPTEDVLFLPWWCSPGLCDRHSCALEWSRALVCRAQSPAWAPSAPRRAKHRRPWGGPPRGSASLRLTLLTSYKTLPATTPGVPPPAPAATTQRVVQIVSRRLQPGWRRPGKHSAAGAWDWDPWAAFPPALPVAESRGSQGGDVTSATDVV